MKTITIWSILFLMLFSTSDLIAGDDWTQKSPSSKPTARDNHAMAYIGNGKVLLYGGWTGTWNGETWIYDLATNTWEQKYPSSSPEARCSHAMAYLGGDQVLMFGGDVSWTRYTSSCWKYDLSDNNWVETEPPIRPGSRRQHAMAYIGDGKVLMVGGDIAAGGGSSYTTWLYDTSDPNQWSQKTDFMNVKWHSMSYVGGDQIMLTSGWVEGRVNWNFLFDLSANNWTQKTDLPVSSCRMDMVYIGNIKPAGINCVIHLAYAIFGCLK
ncbi:hypothetical protein KJ762_16090 [bacterium]|nr:hypothetical protein [bacterium]MBU1064047.1 hypothetical protein [bacterium]MBU1636005.1 hypothetical protein [bacterium]MBU1874651.1 hypothetical protein [bacterium]